MEAFLGRYLRTIDVKGRLALPPKHGKAPGKAYVVTRGLDRCLFVFPKSEWNRYLEELGSFRLESSRARFYVREVTSNAEDVVVDGHGRIMVPPALRELAGLEGEVLVIGALNRIELWNPEVFRKYEEGSGLTFEEVAESLWEKSPGQVDADDEPPKKRRDR